jgi:hypothetical protein
MAASSAWMVCAGQWSSGLGEAGGGGWAVAVVAQEGQVTGVQGVVPLRGLRLR